MKIRVRLGGWTLIAGAALLFLVLFLLYPTLLLLGDSLGDKSAYWQFVQKAYYYRGLFNSLWLSSAATVGSVLLGVPLALLLARYQVPGKRLIQTAAVLSLVSPPFIGAYSWVLLLGRSGFLTNLLHLKGASIYGPVGVLLIFVLHHFAYVYLLVAAALRRVDPSLEEAAASLGAGPVRRLFTVTLPLVQPAIAASALLVFTTTFSDFGTPMLIGEGLRTLPVLAYNEFVSELGSNTKMASALSVIMLLVALVVLLLQSWAVRGRRFASLGVARPAIRKLPPALRWLGVVALLLTGTAALPQLVVLAASFLRTQGPVFTGELGLDNYRQLWSRLLPVINTLVFSGCAALIMLIGGSLLGYILVRRPGATARLLDALLILSQVLPGTVLGVGLVLAWGRPPWALTGTGAILILAYVVRRLAHSVRASAAGLRQISPVLEDASLTLGASPLRTFWRITAPLLFPAAAAGALMGWISTLSELSSTIMLYSARTTTVSIQIYNEVLADSFGRAAALGSVLIVLTLLSLWLLGRFADQQESWSP